MFSVPNYKSETVGEVFPNAVAALSETRVSHLGLHIFTTALIFANEDACVESKQPVGNISGDRQLTPEEVAGGKFIEIAEDLIKQNLKLI